jgi:cytochrome c biogenesis protein CcmG, thiol:disulfide interchange protein DsbE
MWQLIRKWGPRIFSYLLFALVIFQGAMRIPSCLQQSKIEGTKVTPPPLKLIDGSELNLATQGTKKILVFWATWCQPCSVELARYDRLVANQSIPRDSVIAISSFEEAGLVRAAAQERGYQFLVALDPTGAMANQFLGNATPTVVFLDELQQVQLITTGISPSLEIRSLQFLGK